MGPKLDAQKLDRKYPFLLAVAVSALAASNIWYWKVHLAPPMWDDSWYLETSRRLFDALCDGGLFKFCRVFLRAIGTKPPLIGAIAIPFYLVMGASDFAALTSQILFLALLAGFSFSLSIPSTRLALSKLFPRRLAALESPASRFVHRRVFFDLRKSCGRAAWFMTQRIFWRLGKCVPWATLTAGGSSESSSAMEKPVRRSRK